MISSLLKLWIALASVLLPRAARKDWKKEWLAELSYRQRCGVSLAYLVRSARGALRDAAWIRAQTPIDFRFLTTPLRAECLLVLTALALCIWNSALIPPRPHYANLDRLVRFERDLYFAGAINTFLRAPMLDRWRSFPQVEQVVLYNVYVHETVPYARVSPNFFDVLGVKESHGRLLLAGDDIHTAVITHRFWRDRFNSDPHAIGTTFRAGNWTYRVLGILGPRFSFHQCSFFTPLRNDTSYRTITLLKRGVNRTDVEHAIPKTIEYLGARLQPLVSPFSVASLGMAAALVMLPITFALLQRRHSKLYVCARILLGLLCITVINLATFRAINRVSPLLSVLQFWVFCGLCAAVVYFIFRDQRSRCPVCFERLRMPVSIGSWSSLILDRPATEYVCPAGHGVMFVSEALHDPNQWTVLDESWRDLFAETTTS